ncbi:DUF3048 domain-containing protein [Candidatus Saccharibacteria bacterium]|nr:DUF3048 domain-containing protein [Candidatus Saccharibacteria bacterium]
MPVENSTKQPTKPQKKPSEKSWIVFLVLGIFGILGGAGCAAFGFLAPKEKAPDLVFPQAPSAKAADNNIYSNLTGEVVASEDEKNAPAFCIQTPNGTDGARPQVGLNQAGVIFEAIAEAGITRFAAIYQNPSSAVIGPIRSLRMYYLMWDTPFDCTIVHAGGADDALEAVRNGGYRDLTENYAYMYRSGSGSRRWNNLFTTAAYLKQMNDDREYGGSAINGFARMTPGESKKNLIDRGVEEKLVITKATDKDTSAVNPSVTDIAFNFGGWASFNVRYHYDKESNSYARSYESGDAADVYVCPNENMGEPNPDTTCELSVMSPKVVIAMMVEERKAADNYHEDIDAIGSGDAYIFQNGYAVKGHWNKGSAGEQIKFTDENGAEIKLAPGQTFVSAVPTYGNVEY